MTLTLKKAVLPELLKNGYHGVFPYFRKEDNKTYKFITFQFNLHGGSFTVELASSENLESDLPDFLKKEPFEKIEARFLPIGNRHRLNSPKTEDKWFHYENLSNNFEFNLVAQEVLEALKMEEQFYKKSNL